MIFMFINEKNSFNNNRRFVYQGFEKKKTKDRMKAEEKRLNYKFIEKARE